MEILHVPAEIHTRRSRTAQCGDHSIWNLDAATVFGFTIATRLKCSAMCLALYCAGRKPYIISLSSDVQYISGNGFCLMTCIWGIIVSGCFGIVN